MELYEMNRVELQGMLAQLEEALFNHQLWHAAMIRSLACRLPADQHDISPEAHHECRFGQWYYSDTPEKLRDLPGFIALGEEHKRMHQLATKLVLESEAGAPIIAFDYDNFSNALDRMRLEISALERELENTLYNRDALTGAINRFGILSALREHQELIKRGKQSCCIVMMDLDNFKSINDLHGHLAGDCVLTASVQYIIKHIRPYNKVFRYGGEEFLFLIQPIQLDACYVMLERLREGLASTPINFDDKEPIHITASFGLAPLDADAPVETSIDHADKAMYAAKAAGRNCVRIWEAGT